MSKDTVLALIRHVLTFGGGFAVAQGWLGAAELEIAVGAVITLAGVVWSVRNARRAA